MGLTFGPYKESETKIAVVTWFGQQYLHNT